MFKEKDYKYLIGKKINKFEEKKDTIIFYTDSEEIIIDKFVPYCACNVGEYIDEFIINGTLNGIITNIEENIKYNFYDSDDIVYKGNVTFYFENGKLNTKVHGEDNGYYGVIFTMPVRIK